MSIRLAKIQVSRELLAELLFPQWTTIRDIEEQDDGTVLFVVTNPDLPEVRVDDEIPFKQVICQRVDKRFL